MSVIIFIDERHRFGQVPQRDLRFADRPCSRTAPTTFKISVVIPAMVVLRFWKFVVHGVITHTQVPPIPLLDASAQTSLCVQVAAFGLE